MNGAKALSQGAVTPLLLNQARSNCPSIEHIKLVIGGVVGIALCRPVPSVPAEQAAADLARELSRLGGSCSDLVLIPVPFPRDLRGANIALAAVRLAVVKWSYPVSTTPCFA